MRKTEVAFVYQIDLEHRGTTIRVTLIGFSIDEVLAQLDLSKYRNWNVEECKRLISITPFEQIKGKPRVRTWED